MADIIRLNVGGVVYSTTKQTLTSHPDSMLGRMFLGGLPSSKDQDGCYFIDSDGDMFKYVLNFLRKSQLVLPENFNHLEELMTEADFYQIDPLVELLEPLVEAARKPKAEKAVLQVTQIITNKITICDYIFDDKLEGVEVHRAFLLGRSEVIDQLPRKYIKKVLVYEGDPGICKRELDTRKVSELTDFLHFNGYSAISSEMVKIAERRDHTPIFQKQQLFCK